MKIPVRFFVVATLLALSGTFSETLAVTVTYTMQTGNFNSLLTERNNNPPYSGTYNNSAAELGQYANGGSFGNTPGAAAFETFTTTGNGNSGTVRALQVGDTFTITGYTGANPSSGGYIGISFRDSTTYSNFFSATDNTTEARFQLDSSGNWKVYNNGTAVDSGVGANADRTFTIKITSANTFNATVGSTTYYDLSMAASGGTIDSFAIYTFGDSNQNSFWKNASLTDTGTVEFGNGAGNGVTRTISGIIADGLAANSTSSTINNAVSISGDAGSQINFTAANTYSGATTISNNATLEIQNASGLGSTAVGTTVNSGGTLKVWSSSGLTTQAEALTLNGAGVNSGGALLNSGGNNTYAGAITLGSASRINSASGTLTLDVASGNVISGNFGLTFGGSGNVTVNDPIATGANTVTKDGSGVLTLAGVNTYTGATIINAGTISISADSGLGTAPGTPTANQLQFGGGTLAVTGTGFNMTSNRGITLNSGGTIDVVSGGTLAVTGAVAGSGALTKANTGALTLSGVNTYNGGTTLSAGTLNINSTTALGATASTFTISGGTIDNTSGGAITLANNNAQNWNGDFTFTGGNDLNLGTGAVTLGAARQVTVTANNLTVGGIISGGFGITKLGNGTLTLSGSGANTFSGGSTVSAGTLVLNKSANVNAIAGSLTVSSGAIVRTDAANQLNNQLVTVNGTLNLNNQNQSLALAGTSTGRVTLGSATMTINNTGNDSFAGIISGTGGLTKTGAGTQTLSGANDFTGKVQINLGTLSIGAESGLGGAVASVTADQLQFGGGTLAVTGTFNLADNRGITLNSGGGTISVATGQTLTYGGIIAGANNLTKSGSGNLSLGGANSQSGNVYITGGTLALTGSGSLANSARVFIGASGTLDISGITASGTSLNIISENAGSDGGSLKLGSKTLTMNGGAASTTYQMKNIGVSGDTGAFTLNAANSSANLRLYGTGAYTSAYSGATTVQSGTLTVAGALASTTINLTGGNLTMEATNGLDDAAVVTISSGSSTLTVNASDTIGSLAGTAGTVDITGTLTLGSSGDTQFSGLLKGSGNLVKQGGGTFTIDGTVNNLYSGTTTINNGTLLLNKTAGVNAIAGTPTINSGGTLKLGASDQIAGDTTFLTVNAGGTFDMNNFNETLALQGAGDVKLGSGTLTINPTQTDTNSGVISGTGRVIKANTGTQVFAGNNTYTGGTLVSGGTLRIGDGGTTGSVLGDITNNATVTFNRSDAITYSGVMSGTGSLQKWGAGTLTLSGSNTVSGANHYLINGTTLFTSNQGIGGTLNLGDTNGVNAATLALGGSGVTLTNPVLVRAGSSGTMTIEASNTTGTSILSGGITLDRNLTINANAGGNLLITNSALVMTNGGNNNDLTITGANNVTIASAITAPSGASDLNVSGTGTVTLSGNNSANYLKMILNSGTLSVSSLNNLGNTAGGFYGDKINFNGGTLLVTDDLTIAASTFGMTSSANGGTINVASGKTFTQNAAFSSGNAAGAFNKTGAGTLVLGVTTNSINPTFNIKEGIVSITATGALGGGNAITLGDTSTAGTLQFTGTSTSTGRNITINQGGGTIDVTPAGFATTITSTGIISGGGALTKAGESILALSGANTYGKTVITGGMLTVAADNGLGATPGSATADSITIGNGRLGLNGNFTVGANRGITLNNANSTIDVYGGNSATVAGVITDTGSGALTKVGSGTLTLSGANTYSGSTTLNQGILQIAASNNLGAGGVTINSNAVLRATASLTNTRNITITTGQTGYVEAAAGTTNTLNGTLSKNGSVLVLGGGGTHIVNGSIVGANANSDLYVSNSTTTINSTNSYNGPTFIVAGGTLNNGTNNALPTDTALTLGQSDDSSSVTNTYNLSGKDQRVASIAATGTAAANIITNSTGTANLTLSNTVNTNFSNLRMGGSNLTLTKSGANTVTLTSGNSIGPGTIAIQQGTLLLGASSQIGDTTAITMSGGTLDANGFSDVVGRLSFTGSNVSANLKGLNAGTTGNFVFSDLDTSSFGNLAPGGLVFTGGTNYDFNNGFRIQLSTVNLSTDALTTFNTYTDKVSFGVGQQTGAISFTGGGGTYLTVAAIPEPKVYIAAGALALLIGYAEVRRRKRATRA